MSDTTGAVANVDTGTQPPASAPAATPPDEYKAPDGTLYRRVVDEPGKTAPAPTSADPAKASPRPGDPAADPAKAPAGDPVAKAAETAPIKLDDPAKQDPAKTDDAPAVITKAEDYKLSLPEGMTIENDPLLKSFLDTAVTQKLTNEQVQSLVSDWAPKIQQQVEQNNRQAWAGLITKWQQDFAQDPEIGGDAQPAVIATVTAAVRKYGAVTGADGNPDTKDIAAFLSTSGSHSNPAFIRMIYRMAKQLGEGTPVGTGTGTGVGRGGARDPADVMYPTTAAKAA